MNLTSSQQTITDPAPEGPAPSTRLTSLDAYRGFIMLVLAMEGSVPALADKFPGNPYLQALGRQFVHVDWQGGVFWDMIQPSFMLIVGVAMSLSWASRRRRGESAGLITRHVLSRSAILVLLGLMLGSMVYQQTQFQFGEILSQIGLAIPLAYLMVGKSPRVQVTACVLILAGFWLAFVLYPLPAANFDYTGLQIPIGAGPFTGLYAHWNKYTNLANAFDRWFLNLFPRSSPFLGNATYGATLLVIPSAVTMTFGIMAGDLLRGPVAPGEKVRRLVFAGAAAVVLGLLLGHTLCPIVKNLWTPSWVFYSGGIALLALALTYWLTDVRGWRRLAFPFVVAGANSLAMYLMIRLIKFWLWTNLEIHLVGTFHLKHAWAIDFLAGTMIMWLICLWLYRHKVFIRA